MNAFNQLLLSVLLFIEQVNQRFAERLASGERPSLDEVVALEREALKATGAWACRSDLSTALANLGLAPIIDANTLDTVSSLIIGPSRPMRSLAAQPAALPEASARSQWHEPVTSADALYVYRRPGRPSLANVPLEEELEVDPQVVDISYVDEPVDPVSLLSQYLIETFRVREPLVHHVLQTWARALFGLKDDESHRQQLRHICHGLNRLLYGTEHPSRHHLHPARPVAVTADIVRDQIEGLIKGRSEEHGRTALGLQLMLRFARVLRWRKAFLGRDAAAVLVGRPGALAGRLVQPFDVVTATRPFDPTHLLGRTFGEQTSIPGLNYVFRGGMLMPLERGHVTVISGPAGCGKTVLALQLLADLAARGGFGVYLSLEETTDALLERLRVFELEDPRFVIARAPLSEVATFFEGHPLNPDRGLLLLVDCTADPDTPGPPAPSLERFLQQVCEVFAHYFVQRAVVLDSLNVLDLPAKGPNGAHDEHQERLALRNLLDEIRARRLRCIAISEGDSVRAFGKLSHLADTAIRLEWHEQQGRRSLEVVKCRTQDFHAGRHLFRLSDGRGVRIYPSLASVRSTLRRRTPSTLSDRRTLWFEAAPGTPAPAPIKDRGMILISGPTGVGRSRLALRLLLEPTVIQQGDRRTEHNPGGVLVINFSTPEAKYLQRLTTFGERHRWDRVPFSRIRWYSPGENLSGSQLVDELRQIIAESRRKNHPIERVLFEDVDATDRFLPSLVEDRLFWPTLLELTTVEPFVSIFVARSNDDPKSVTATIRDAVDYSLRLRSAGPNTTHISFEKVDGVWLAEDACHMDWQYTAPIARG
ncbi:MAG: RAD55 family ATPase [Vicinamibacterales bacterium]